MRSAKAQNKHLSLQQAINFLSAKAPGVQVPDYFLGQLADVEEELYDEISVKLRGSRKFGSSREGQMQHISGAASGGSAGSALHAR